MSQVVIQADLEKVFFICTACKGLFSSPETDCVMAQQIVATEVDGNFEGKPVKSLAAPLCPSCAKVLDYGHPKRGRRS